MKHRDDLLNQILQAKQVLYAVQKLNNRPRFQQSTQTTVLNSNKSQQSVIFMQDTSCIQTQTSCYNINQAIQIQQVDEDFNIKLPTKLPRLHQNILQQNVQRVDFSCRSQSQVKRQIRPNYSSWQNVRRQ
uniref:Uncharacterized protein n=1 Tax=Spironucleus salmonicida TaxID=348837 RepID=V6LSF6_9EUKA|eukprot:EST47535.1 Hypothetical protein SS50377_12519 [Spironucleus salmonicida]